MPLISNAPTKIPVTTSIYTRKKLRIKQITNGHSIINDKLIQGSEPAVSWSHISSNHLFSNIEAATLKAIAAPHAN